MRTTEFLQMVSAAAIFTALAIPGVAEDAFPTCWRGQPGTTYQNWEFDTPVNPANPEFFSNVVPPTAFADVAMTGAGWIDTLFLFEPRQGIWDLGPIGAMTLEIQNIPLSTNDWKYISVQVTQYRDTIYAENASVTIPGATLVSTQTEDVGTAPQFGGKWVVHQSVWLIQPCPASETIVLTAGPTGSSIDQVIVDTRCTTGDDGDVFIPCWRGQPGSTYQSWSFHNNQSPVSPEQTDNPGPVLADIALGTLSFGWQDQDASFGCRQGYWDLGSTGAITFDVANAPGSMNSYKYVRVQTVQYHDLPIYNTPAMVTVPGAILVSPIQQMIIETTPFGVWITEESVWRLDPCPSSETVVVTAGINGSLIDQVIIDTLCIEPAACPPDQLVNNDLGLCSSTNVTWSLPTVDGCLVQGAESSPPVGTAFPVGTTTVTNTVLDAESQAYECTFAVTVNDTESPIVVACATNQSIVSDGDCLAAMPDFTSEVSATDNCGVPAISQTPLPGTSLEPGMHTIGFLVEDGAGNSTFCNMTLVVDYPSNLVLTIERGVLGDSHVLCWPDTCDAYFLEATESLDPPATWDPVLIAPVAVSNHFCVTVPATNNVEFYRLSR